jgi:hypothetical protein
MMEDSGFRDPMSGKRRATTSGNRAENEAQGLNRKEK